MQELAPFAPRLPKKSAFTLAEILITFAIIGIVATVVIPTFVNNFNNHVYNEKKINILYKFNKITENMNSNNLIGPYNSTEDFVFNLQRFMKIAQVCNSSNIADCWPTKTIKTTDNNDFEVSNLKTGKNFGTDGYTNSMMGIVSADGTPFILTYKDECPQLSSETVYPWTVEGGKPTVNATSQCVAMMFDINGAKGPNKVGKDILATGNVTQIGGGCAGVELASGACMDIIPTPYELKTYAECQEFVANSSDYGSLHCDSLSYKDYNAFIGATMACQASGKRLVSFEEIASVLSEIVGEEVVASAPATYVTNKNYVDETLAKYGFSNENLSYSNVYFTTKEGNASNNVYAPRIYFNNNGYVTVYIGMVGHTARGSNKPIALCVSD